MSNAPTIESKVLSALSRQGFPFELKVGNQCRASGWAVTHGDLYTDPTTGKLREIDVLASRQTKDSKTPVVRLTLVIECKQSPTRPWVALTSTGFPILPFLSAAYVAGKLPYAALLTLPDVEKKRQLRLLSTDRRRNHGIVAVSLGKEAKRGPNVAFAAVRTAATAADALAADWDSYEVGRYSEDPRTAGPITGFTIFLPVVVVADKLFEFEVDGTGAEKLSAAEHVQVLAPASTASTRKCLVSVVTPAGIAGLLKRAEEDFETLAQYYREDSAQKMQELTARFRT